MRKFFARHFLLIVMIVTAVALFVPVLSGGEEGLALIYAVVMVISIPALYFNYSWCKLHNVLHGALHEASPSEGEPSAFHLVTGKIGGWICFLIGMGSGLAAIFV